MKASKVLTVSVCVLSTLGLYACSYACGNKGIALLATMCAMATIYVAAFPKKR